MKAYIKPRIIIEYMEDDIMTNMSCHSHHREPDRPDPRPWPWWDPRYSKESNEFDESEEPDFVFE